MEKNIHCTLTDQELYDAVEVEIQKLIDTGGESFTMRVPARPNKDTDLLLAELNNRFKKLATEPTPQAAVWVKGTKGFPVRKQVIAKMWHEIMQRTVVGTASSATGDMVAFDWGTGAICLPIDHEDLKELYWLDESPEQGKEDITEEDLSFLDQCNLVPHADKSLKVVTELDEGSLLSREDLVKLVDILSRYAK